MKKTNSRKTTEALELIMEEKSLKKKKKKKIKKDKSNSKLEVVETESSTVRMNTLQSIFASKDEEGETFKLFGNEIKNQLTYDEDISKEKSVVSPMIVPLVQSEIITSVTDRFYFFPHYDSREKNSLSLFTVLDEPFFYNRTDEEKRRIWSESKYDLTQDWKKKRKAALKQKRRNELRKRF